MPIFTVDIQAMKNLFAVLAFALLGTGAFAQSDADFNLEITGETTREQLAEMRTELLAKGFDFRYSPTFDQELKLVKINVHLVEQGGELKGSFQSNQLQAGHVIRLIRNTQEGAEVPFCVGNCPAQ